MDPLEDCFKQLAGIFPIFEKAVQHQAEARIELGLVYAAEQKITDHKGNHADERCRRRLQSSKTLERWIAFATQPQNLAVEMLLARKVPKQQRLGNAGRLGQLFGGGARKPFPRKERNCRGDDRLSPLVAVQSGGSHRARKVSAYLLAGQAILLRYHEDLKLKVILADTSTGKDHLNEAVWLF